MFPFVFFGRFDLKPGTYYGSLMTRSTDMALGMTDLDCLGDNAVFKSD